LFSAGLTRPVIAERFTQGAHIVQRQAADDLPEGADLLFLIRADGRLVPAGEQILGREAGDTMVLLSSAVPQPRSAVPVERSTAAADSPDF
jgi:hypothetical protein